MEDIENEASASQMNVDMLRKIEKRTKKALSNQLLANDLGAAMVINAASSHEYAHPIMIAAGMDPRAKITNMNHVNTKSPYICWMIILQIIQEMAFNDELRGAICHVYARWSVRVGCKIALLRLLEQIKSPRFRSEPMAILNQIKNKFEASFIKF